MIRQVRVSEYRDTIKTVLSHIEGVGYYQSFVLVIFMLYFLLLIVYVYTRPKNYYKDVTSFLLKD